MTVPKIDFDFWQALPDLLKLYNYNDQFIVATGYTYSFNSSPLNHRRNRHSLRASIETAGNFLNLLSHVTGQKKNEDGRYELVGVPYSQYVKTDIDFFLLRFDTGFKAYDPQQEGSRKWAITRFNFKDNFAWHFAVGYPF